MLLGDTVAPDFPEESFDVVVSRNLIWTLRQLDRAARGWRRVLRVGGRVVVLSGFSNSAEEAPAEPGDGSAEGSACALEERRQEVFERYYSEEVRAAVPMFGTVAP